MNVSTAFAKKFGASHAVVKCSVLTSLADVIACAGTLIAEMKYTAKLHSKRFSTVNKSKQTG